MRWFVALVLLLALAVVLADRGLASFAEARAEAEVRERVGVAADVELRGTLAGVRLLLGTAPLVTAEARDVTLWDGLRVGRIRAELTDVRVSLDMSTPSARTADFVVEVHEDDALRLLPIPEGLAAGLVLEPDRLLLLLGDAPVETHVRVRDGVLLVGPEPVPDLLAGLLPLRLDLTARPGGPAITAFEIRDGRLILRGVLRDLLREPR